MMVISSLLICFRWDMIAEPRAPFDPNTRAVWLFICVVFEKRRSGILDRFNVWDSLLIESIAAAIRQGVILLLCVWKAL